MWFAVDAPFALASDIHWATYDARRGPTMVDTSCCKAKGGSVESRMRPIFDPIAAPARKDAPATAAMTTCGRSWNSRRTLRWTVRARRVTSSTDLGASTTEARVRTRCALEDSMGSPVPVGRLVLGERVGERRRR